MIHAPHTDLSRDSNLQPISTILYIAPVEAVCRLLRLLHVYMVEQTNPCPLAGIRLLFAHNASLGALEETDDITYLGTVGHLLPDLVDHIERAGLTMEQQTVRIGSLDRKSVV